MSWLTNSGAPRPHILNTIFDRVYGGINRSLYRSRETIDTSILEDIAVLLYAEQSPMKNDRFNIYSYAMQRGVTSEELKRLTEQILKTSCYTSPSGGHNLVVCNSSGNTNNTDTVIQHLKERCNFVEHEYSTALTITPYHKVTVLFREATAEVSGVMYVFTTEYSDEFLVKLGAVLHVLYKIPTTDAISSAYLKGDRAAFYDALYDFLKDDLIKLERQRKEADIKRNIDSIAKSAVNLFDRDITSIKNNIEDYERGLRDLYMRLTETNIKKASQYWGNASNPFNEFYEYLIKADVDNILQIAAADNNTTLYVWLLSKFLYWDEKLFDNYFKSKGKNCITGLSKERLALVTSVFIDKTVEVQFMTPIKISLSECMMSYAANYTMNMPVRLGIPHTHLSEFNCWGNNRTPIQKALSERNFIIAWEQLKSTVSGINVTDLPVFERFINKITSSSTNVECLILKDTGRRLKPLTFMQEFPEGYKFPEVIIPEVAAIEPIEPKPRTKRTIKPQATEEITINLDPREDE